MSWDGTCPWGYDRGYIDHMPNCVWNGGLADASEVPLDIGGQLFWPTSSSAYTHGKAGAAAAGQGLAPVGGRISEVMQVPAGGMDWTTLLIYGGIAVVVLALVSKGRR